MPSRPLLIVILAAGKGTRMKSATPKVLHRVAGRSMLGHAIATAQALSPDRIAAVVGPDMANVRAEIARMAPGAATFEQTEQLGTAHAVLSAREVLADHQGDVMVLYGDTPLILPATLSRLRAELDRGAAIGVLGFEAADPGGYGRLLVGADGTLEAIREAKDATAAERAVKLCNSGVMAFRVPDLVGLLGRIGTANAKGEFYLTDAIALAREAGLRATAIACPEEEVLGVNSRDQLAEAEAIWQRRARLAAMQAGVTMIAPETVWLSHDTVLGTDVTIEPNVVIGRAVTIEDRAIIKANTHIEGADAKGAAGVRIRAGAEVGPFARIRPGADIGPDVHIGNFVEVKAATLEKGAKANHLAYIGDGRVGEGANIGAGTIFCNYDGFRKHFTDVGKGAFVGSNTSLVAPVTIGDGAFVGSGSVITANVSPDALAVERSAQEERPGWAAKFRTLMSRRKGDKKG